MKCFSNCSEHQWYREPEFRSFAHQLIEPVKIVFLETWGRERSRRHDMKDASGWSHSDALLYLLRSNSRSSLWTHFSIPLLCWAHLPAISIRTTPRPISVLVRGCYSRAATVTARTTDTVALGTDTAPNYSAKRLAQSTRSSNNDAHKVLANFTISQ